MTVKRRCLERLLLVLSLLWCVPLCLSGSSTARSALMVVEGSEPDGEAQVSDDEDPEDLEVFQPTNQWQELRPGQAVPAGSHVRLDLQTGKREAKLQDSPGEEAGGRQGMVNTESQTFTAQELKKALKHFKEAAVVPTDEEKEAAEALRAQFRPLEELKRDMEALGVMMETDFQIMSRLLQQFNSSAASLEERVSALREMEYLVHQVDTAQDFVTIGGLQLVIGTLNSSVPVLQEHAALVLGSALSSNPVVQVESVEGGALQKLLLLLATEQPLPVKKKALFAMASLLRHFPFAQQRFLKLGGLQVLEALFLSPGGASLRVRAVTLLYDMIVEKELILQHGLDPVPDASYEARLQQYSQVSVLPQLAERGWCGLVPELLASPEHDVREKALRALLAMMPPCQELYRGDRALAAALSLLQEQYQGLAESERSFGDENGYFGELLGLVESMLGKLR
ncbi:nucleotide exchange factor SIL1 [Polyodon spathula]|uniref:nucleotide exchange factor SIL1 n=1 Tax=Polyodon spathula TaxID=7913 RepID=UPI001B7ECB6F|nr:nucleotide exchange factor SIL1 [Polyodon spathula]